MEHSEIVRKFWSTLKSDRTVMLALAVGSQSSSQPMTAVVEDDEGGPIWVFTSKETDFAKQLQSGQPAIMHFSSKDHDVFACVEGRLTPDNDPAVIDRLWNPFIAAWYEGGRSDPKLLLTRFDPDHARIWRNENSLLAGIKMLMGADPKEDYRDKVADADL